MPAVGSDPRGQAGQQRPAAGQPDLAPDHVLGQAGRDLRQHLVHGGGDRRHDRLEGGRHQAPGTFSDRGVRCATSRPTTSAEPSAPPVTPSVVFRCRAARWLMIRPSSFRAACTIASSMALPALRSDRDLNHPPARPRPRPRWCRRRCRPRSRPPRRSGRTRRRPPRPPARRSGGRCTWGAGTLSAATIDRRSTGVAPLGTHTRALGRSGLPRLRARRRNACSMAAVASRSAMTPSRSGWITWMSCGSLSASASRRLADGRDLADRRIDGDRGRLLEHDAAAGHPDERVHGAEIDRHATPEAHAAPLLSNVTPLNPTTTLQARPAT